MWHLQTGRIAGPLPFAESTTNCLISQETEGTESRKEMTIA
jgi:hypothetical protein